MFQDDAEFFSLLVQVWGLLTVVALTLLWRRRKWVLAVGPVLMLVVNFVAQVLLAGGGPGACAGLLVLPFYGLVVSWLTLRLAGPR